MRSVGKEEHCTEGHRDERLGDGEEAQSNEKHRHSVVRVGIASIAAELISSAKALCCAEMHRKEDA